MPKPLISFLKQYRYECICFVLLFVMALIGFSTHEPLYDESQAWQIAKTASWGDMVWGIIPLFEGHPPFWHLLLAIPAKLGISFFTATTVLGMLFLIISWVLLLFKSPFPRWVRCCLPFGFFLFYQYGIVVRPYGLMMVILFLLANFFPQKDRRPGLFVGLLAGLCACHLFGIAIAGGMTLAWLWEIKGEQSWKAFFINLRSDIRFKWMLRLLAWVLLIMACVAIPRGGIVLQTKAAPPVSVVRQAVYVLADIPAEAVLTDFDSSVHTTAQMLPWAGLLSTAAVGLLLWVLTLLYTPRKKWSYLLLPYVCLSIVLVGYSSCHHVGVALLLFIWYFWINLQTPADMPKRPALLNTFANIVLGGSLLLPIAWNLNVLYWDYKLVLFPGKDIVAFLKKYNLTDQTIFITWRYVEMSNGDAFFNPNVQAMGPMLNIYLDHNIFANFNDGGPKAYAENFFPSAPVANEILNKWRNKDVPTVLIDEVPMDFLYNNPMVLSEYRTAYISEINELWKLNPPKKYPLPIYFFRTLWDKYKDQILAEAANNAATLPK